MWQICPVLLPLSSIKAAFLCHWKQINILDIAWPEYSRKKPDEQRQNLAELFEKEQSSIVCVRVCVCVCVCVVCYRAAKVYFVMRIFISIIHV